MKHFIVFGLFIISTVLLLLHWFSPLDITNNIIVLIIDFIAFSTFAIILIGYILKLKGDKLILYSSLMVGLLFIIAYPFSWFPAWETKSIIYQNLHLANRTIEFQMQDMGAIGANQRTVDRIKLIPYFDWTKEINPDSIDNLTWKKVGIDIN
jgi:hypothetical protein